MAPFAAFHDAFASIDEASADEQATLLRHLSKTLTEFARRTDRDIKASQQRAGRTEYAATRASNSAREAQAQIDLGAMQRTSIERLRWDVAANHFGVIHYLGPELITPTLRLEFERVSDKKDAQGNPAMT
ncbi:hypothetical protein N9L68_06940 [bacterium]|nr:hypothetical protein [bacterium]